MTAPPGQKIASRRSTYSDHVQGVRTWLRSHPWEADLALAVLVFLASLGETGNDPLIRMVSLCLAATVLARRKYPVEAFTAAAAIAALQVLLGLRPQGVNALGLQQGGYYFAAWQPTASDIAVAILLYTLAAQRPRRISVAGLTVCLILSGIAISRWAPAYSARPSGSILAAATLLGSVSLTAWVLGDSVAYRHRVTYLATLEERAARLEAERDAQIRIAAGAERARVLQERRARAVDESAARLRRIERDLHDGAQVRLTALALTLGEIKENLGAASGGADDDADQARTRMLIGAAHRNAKETLVELRDLARGIHPAVLDRGLNAALSVLAETSATPVALTVTIADRPSPAIEAIAYFCAAELLANVAKHGNARHATVAVTEQDGELMMTVTDDGTGGARITPGGGLDGLRERVQTVDGRLAVVSPDGGPTTVSIALPGHA